MKKAIIAGNAPSLKNIDYTLLPQDYDVFRCNQFYLEDKYYLGKKLKAVFFNSCV
ncbi:alpha-2,3 sialyltransferase, partial [Campylobacter upsaliensis]|nr:alpha-2,3 sialyltransferase [Campylobacter upsaliensis]